MANWFSRRRKRAEAPHFSLRSSDQATTKVDLGDLTPSLPEFLGRASYVQLTIFENLGRAIAIAPTTAVKVELGEAAELSLAKHRALCDEIERDGVDAASVMEPHTRAVDEFQRMTAGANWLEAITTSYVTAGFLDEFFVLLAAGLAPDPRARVRSILEPQTGEPILAALLQTAMADDPRLSSSLALWGRRLVGDTMLVARAALNFTENAKSDEAHLEPVFTELIAAHTRRMDLLGLTA
ncbi:MAG: ferritin-like domain-containing protein [Salinibacterium sp.]|nr:ferritin-like domain-containing protein [Salinibacterium sp.]